MSHPLRISLLMLVSIFFCLSLSSKAVAADFVNPVFRSPMAGCQTNNLKTERFPAEMNIADRVKLCLAIDSITSKLNSNSWSPSLLSELTEIWVVFSNESVNLRLMPKETSSRILAMTESFPAGSTGNKFQANVYIRPEKSDDDSFFQVLLHELRHVFDFYETWKNRTKLSSLDLERRAFLLMSKLAQEAPGSDKVSNLPKFWKSDWAGLPAEESLFRRQKAINDFLFGNKIYRELAKNEEKAEKDATYVKTTFKSEPNLSFAKTNGERLPDRQPLPETASLIPQNIKDIDFNLEKPKNLRDEKEILRVALQNETKLYYGMSNFAYDQNLAFQCWSKGKVVSEFVEKDTIARTTAGNTLKTPTSANASNSPCLTNYQDLKTDFTETFWASPALEEMPITFAGFVDVNGKTLARYTVLQPDEKLFNRMAKKYSFIKPFRVFIGTIFVSPEDGQIVKFWGTSFPDEKITNNNSQKVYGSYLVTALRQKLNINAGIWVTVYISTSAAANVENKLRPFSYTVKFNNYRQSSTDVRILEDNDAVSIAAQK